MPLWDVNYPAVVDIFISAVEAETGEEAIQLAMEWHNKDAYQHIASMLSAYNYRNPADVPAWMTLLAKAEPHNPETLE